MVDEKEFFIDIIEKMLPDGILNIIFQSESKIIYFRDEQSKWWLPFLFYMLFRIICMYWSVKVMLKYDRQLLKIEIVYEWDNIINLLKITALSK